MIAAFQWLDALITRPFLRLSSALDARGHDLDFQVSMSFPLSSLVVVLFVLWFEPESPSLAVYCLTIGLMVISPILSGGIAWMLYYIHCLSDYDGATNKHKRYGDGYDAWGHLLVLLGGLFLIRTGYPIAPLAFIVSGIPMLYIAFASREDNSPPTKRRRRISERVFDWLDRTIPVPRLQPN